MSTMETACIISKEDQCLSCLLDTFRLQLHLTDTVNPAVNVVIALYDTYVFTLVPTDLNDQ